MYANPLSLCLLEQSQQGPKRQMFIKSFKQLYRTDSVLPLVDNESEVVRSQSRRVAVSRFVFCMLSFIPT